MSPNFSLIQKLILGNPAVKTAMSRLNPAVVWRGRKEIPESPLGLLAPGADFVQATAVLTHYELDDASVAKAPFSVQAEPALGEWGPDVLGEGFECTTIPLGTDPDGETDIVATLVRYAPAAGATESVSGEANSGPVAATGDPAAAATGDAERAARDLPALFFVHGYTDYFFQSSVAKYFHDQGFPVYAIDLRKCGRSYRPGQSYHHATDFAQYYVELTRALDLITAAHEKVVPVGHSTGGLNVALWVDYLAKVDPARHSHIAAVVFNSPWVGFQLPAKAVAPATKVIRTWAALRPNSILPLKESTAYVESIHLDHHGEWDFNLDWKPLVGPQKQASWLSAVLVGQRYLQSGAADLKVPVFQVHSATSLLSLKYGSHTHENDVILQVSDMVEVLPLLSATHEDHAFPGAIHDVFLSASPVREAALAATREFLLRIAG